MGQTTAMTPFFFKHVLKCSAPFCCRVNYFLFLGPNFLVAVAFCLLRDEHILTVSPVMESM